MKNPVRLRIAQIEDIPGIWSVCFKLIDAFNYFTYEDFYEVCLYRWLKNPFKEEEVFGWVLEDGEKNIVGFFGLIPMKVKVGDMILQASAGTTWAVDPQYRAYSLLLYKAFLSWGEKNLILSTTPSPASSKINEQFKMKRIPLPYFDKRFIWFIKTLDTSSWWIKKIKDKNLFTMFIFNDITVFPISALLKIWTLRHRKVGFKCDPLPVERIEVFTDEYDDFWHANKHYYDITVVRTKDFLNWRHIKMPKILGENYVFACKVNGKLKGYITIHRRINPQKIPYHFKVTDIFYDVTNTDVLYNLINHAFTFAKNNKGNIFEIDDFGLIITDEAMKQNPFIKTAITWSYWYKAPTKEIENICSTKEWWPSGVDGDRNI